MKNLNLTYHKTSVTLTKRQELNKHKSLVIWFTGLSGSGKSTIANSLELELYKLGCRSYVLDGDNIRYGLSSDLTFSKNDRKENIRRIGEVSKLMMDAGLITITAFISPFKKDRNFVRKLIPKGVFIEIFCKASLKTCELRDIKGIYKKARLGKIKSFTGIDSPYEKPDKPELIIDTEKLSVSESVTKIKNFLNKRKLI